MRKTDYEAIAAAINDTRWINVYTSDATATPTSAAWHALEDIAYALADYCASRDKTFKRDRFLADCGIVDRAAEANEAALRG
jgi:hypothetical protein